MLLISIWHGAWEQRKGCLSSVSKKEKLESFLSSDSITWTASSSVVSVPGSSLCLGHEKCFATQISEEPLFWCALVVPWGVLDMALLASEASGVFIPQNWNPGICKFPLGELFLAAAGSRPQAGKLAGKPHPAWLLTCTLVLTGKVLMTECLGLRQLKVWTLRNVLLF